MRRFQSSRKISGRSVAENQLTAVIAFTALLTVVRTQICPMSGIQAGINFNISTVTNTFTSGNHYLMVGKGEINCNGVIQDWTFHSLACNSGSIDFEVWRPISAGVYQLIGRNSYTEGCSLVTNLNPVTFGIGPVNQLPVEPGYVIGWYQQPTNALEISYTSMPTDANSFYATATGNPPLGGTLTASANIPYQDPSLKVTIKQGDYPTLDNLPAQVNISENIPVASSPVLFTVLASHICNSQYIDAVLLSFSWSAGLPFVLKNVSPTTNGQATVTESAPLDYETQSVYQLAITVTGLGLSTTSILTINVIDVDEQHTISNLVASIVVPAPSTATGDQVFLVQITDPDINPPVPVRFYLSTWSSPDTTSDIPPFAVDPDTGSVTATTDLKNWFLQNPTPTPYPSSVIYDLTILATDGQLSDSKVLTVKITQIKQPPLFLNLPGSVTINDNLAVNTVIFQVVVSPTSDTNLTFQMTPASADFCIDQLSGDVSICSFATLNGCTKNSYQFTITATNSALSSQSTLDVTVQPIKTVPSFGQTVYSGSVYSDCPSSSGSCSPVMPVVTVTVIDGNCSPVLICNVLLGTGSQFFDIFTCQTVRNTKPIDLDSFPQYENISLVIELQDSGLTSYATVNVFVIGVNEYAPIFSESIYNASILENSVGGTSLVTVSATDPDRGINGEFHFSILTTDPSFLYFQVDSQSGLVTTKQPLDFETKSWYTVTVWAIDEGTIPGPLNSSTTVYVTVIDVNDVRPQIVCTNRPTDEPYPPQPCFYNFDLKYDAIIGSNVSNVVMIVTDSDPVPWTAKLLQLVAEPHFTLDGTNGLIQVTTSVEAYKKYVLYVYAEDNGSPSLKSRIVYVRIDTYRPSKHWIDLTVRPETAVFDSEDFLLALRNVTSPWFMKIVSVTNYDPTVEKDVIVTVYALADISTYFPGNITDEKVFVPRDEMLNKLRTNIYGDPRELLRGPMFEGTFPVIKVMPTYINWWLDTVEGIATMTCLAAIPFIIATLILVAILKANKLLCFKQTASENSMKTTNPDRPSTDLSQRSNQDSIRYRSSHGRRDSVLTVHSDIGL